MLQVRENEISLHKSSGGTAHAHLRGIIGVVQGGLRLRTWRATSRFEKTFAGRKERNSIAIKRLVRCYNKPIFVARLTEFSILG